MPLSLLFLGLAVVGVLMIVRGWVVERRHQPAVKPPPVLIVTGTVTALVFTVLAVIAVLTDWKL